MVGDSKIGEGKKDNFLNSSLEFARIVIFTIVLFLVFYAPFLKGLYFEFDGTLQTEIFVFATFILFWVYKLLKKDRRFLETPLDYASFGFVVVYFLSLFVAAGLRPAIGEWLKYCMYFAVFFMISELLVDYKSRLVTLWTIVASATGVALLGIDGAANGKIANIINQVFDNIGLKIKIFDTFANERVNSTLQYPNSLAAYIMCTFFITIGLIIISKKLWIKVTTGILAFIMLLTFILAQSRGAYLVMLGAILIICVLLPKGVRLKGIVYIWGIGIVTVPISIKMASYISGNNISTLKIWTLLLVGIFLSGLIILILEFTIKWLEKVNWKVYLGIGLSIATLIGVLTYYILNATVAADLSHSNVQPDSVHAITKTIYLKPDIDYKLSFDLNATSPTSQNYSCEVDIRFKDEKGMTNSTSMPLASNEFKSTNGYETKDVNFKVPSTAKIVDISFINYYSGTKAIINNAQITEVGSNRVVKNIKLKYKYLPDTIVSRLESYNNSQFAEQRKMYYIDGMKIFKDHWLLGAGGKAWSMIYFSYQSFSYASNETHSFILQIATDCGIVGLFVFVLLILSITTMFIIFRKSKNKVDLNEKVMQSFVFVALLSLLAHSVIDFDFSLPAIALLFWALIAVFNSRFRNKELTVVKLEDEEQIKIPWIFEKIKAIKAIKCVPIIGILIIASILTFSIMIYVAGEVYGNAAIRATKGNDMVTAAKELKGAMALDPLKPEYKIDYATVLIRKQNLTSEDVQDANKAMESGERLAKNRSELMAPIGNYYLRTGNIEKAQKYFDNATILRPLVVEEWQNRIAAYNSICMYYFSKQDITNALKSANKILKILDEAKDINKGNSTPFIFNKSTDEMIEKLKYVVDNANAKKSIDISKIIFYNMPFDIDSDGVPDQWNNMGQSNIKISNAADVMVVENSISNQTNFIQSRYLSILPGRSYRVELELVKSEGISGIPFAITGSNQVNGLLIPEANMYVAEISIPDDFKNENSTILLSSTNKYEIKKLSILEK
jgi:tetratricopeptide (TPR) repeat protein